MADVIEVISCEKCDKLHARSKLINIAEQLICNVCYEGLLSNCASPIEYYLFLEMRKKNNRYSK